MICSVCGATNRENAKFCAKCSVPFNLLACLQCGQGLRPGSKFCSRCGAAHLTKNESNCPHCGQAMVAGRNFCPHCGQAVISCPYCGGNLRPTARFCAHCSQALTTKVLAQPPLTCPHCAAGNRLNSRFCQQCGKPLVSELLKQRFDTGQLPAQQILANGQGDEYFVVMLIAKGGMGAVYQVIRNRDQTVWALKEMSESAVGVSEIAHVIASFQQEAEILKQLEHPNLPKVIDSFEANGRQYMVMDFIDGQTLGQLLEQTSDPLPEKQVMGWATQLCQVLDYLHNQQPPIVYRDLKPANIMVNTSGEVKLIDFGIARRYKGSKKQDTTLLGTPGYAPPEQYGKNQIESDARSDIYALGATLHHLLTGLDPATSPFQFDPIEKFNPKVSPRVREGVMKALRPRPEDRVPSAAALYQALTNQPLPRVGPVIPITVGLTNAVSRPVEMGSFVKGSKVTAKITLNLTGGLVKVASESRWLKVTPAVADSQTGVLEVEIDTQQLGLGRQEWWAGYRPGTILAYPLLPLVWWVAFHARLFVPVAKKHQGVVQVGQEKIDLALEVAPTVGQRRWGQLFVLLAMLVELGTAASLLAVSLGIVVIQGL